MPINILMPALSPTMEKGNVAKWLKKVGDKIKSGDIIAEIETDKATMEVEAVDEGTLAQIVVTDGTQDVPVNQVIGVIAGEDEDAQAVAKVADQVKAVEAKDAPAPAASSAAAPAASTPAPSPPPVAAPPTASATPPAGGRVFASPLARRIAKDSAIDLAGLSGSGPHGRIVERDVKAAMANGTAGAKPAAQPATATAASASAPPKAAPVSMSDETIKKFFEPGSFTETPHDGMRKTIARRLVEAKQTIPHFYLTLDCDLDALMALREQINAAAPRDKDGKPAYKVSVNDFVIKALALALIRVPDANATWTEGAMLKHKHADIGVAVSIPGGLITPVVRKAETKTLSTISSRDERLRGARQGPQAEARGISGRLECGVQPRHVRHQEFLRRHQPAACHDPGGRRGRTAGGGEERCARSCDADERDALDRPSRRRWRIGGGADQRIQRADRKADGHAGLTPRRMP